MIEKSEERSSLSRYNTDGTTFTCLLLLMDGIRGFANLAPTENWYRSFYIWVVVGF